METRNTRAHMESCMEVVRRLQRHLRYDWFTADNGRMWRLGTIIQVLDPGPPSWEASITIFANLNGDARIDQHLLSFHLQGGVGRVRLGWNEGNPIALRRAQRAFAGIYPLSYLLADIEAALCAVPLDNLTGIRPATIAERLSG